MKKGYLSEFSNFCLLLTLIIVLSFPRVSDWAWSLIQSMSITETESAAAADDTNVTGGNETNTTTGNVGAALSSFFGFASIGTLVYSLGLTLDKIVPYSLKDRLLFPLGGLPATRVFSDIKKGIVWDSRIQINEAKERYSAILSELDNLPTREEKPKDVLGYLRLLLNKIKQLFERLARWIKRRTPEGQVPNRADYENSEWYKIFLAHLDHEVVSEMNAEYLYCRDAATLSAAALAACAIVHAASLFAKGVAVFPARYFVLQLVLTAFLVLAARDKARRLVGRVIAIDLYEANGQKSATVTTPLT